MREIHNNFIVMTKRLDILGVEDFSYESCVLFCPRPPVLS